MKSRQRAGAAGARPFWRGFVAFGLVQLPIELHSAEAREELDFDLLDARDLQPIGYLKVNKATGEEVPKEEIVRGVALGRGRHVVVSDDEIEAAAGEKGRTFEIESFVERGDLPLAYVERPVHVAPGEGGEKVYALLAAALAATGRLGLGRIVLRSRESLAALAATDGRLELLLLRWPHELKPAPKLPAAAKGAAKNDKSLAMAKRLVDEMSGDFRPAAWSDRFHEALLALVRRRARTGEAPRPKKAAKRRDSGNVVDLVSLLEKSVQARSGKRSTAGRVKKRAGKGA